MWVGINGRAATDEHRNWARDLGHVTWRNCSFQGCARKQAAAVPTLINWNDRARTSACIVSSRCCSFGRITRRGGLSLQQAAYHIEHTSMFKFIISIVMLTAECSFYARGIANGGKVHLMYCVTYSYRQISHFILFIIYSIICLLTP